MCVCDIYICMCVCVCVKSLTYSTLFPGRIWHLANKIIYYDVKWTHFTLSAGETLCPFLKESWFDERHVTISVCVWRIDEWGCYVYTEPVLVLSCIVTSRAESDSIQTLWIAKNMSPKKEKLCTFQWSW